MSVFEHQFMRGEDGRFYGFDPQIGIDRIVALSGRIPHMVMYTKKVKVRQDRYCTLCHSVISVGTDAYVVCYQHKHSSWFCYDNDKCTLVKSVSQY